MLHVTELKTTKQKLELLKAGNCLDMTLSNGPIYSSKEAQAYQKDGQWFYFVFHNIDGTETNFTESAFIEVLEGKRDIWDGDNDDC